MSESSHQGLNFPFTLQTSNSGMDLQTSGPNKAGVENNWRRNCIKELNKGGGR